ncbi:FAD dependent oxidoreductase [Lentibacillus halodurans]|uniref:FAD dependent oxidoreductase n=1 Tax=Lentibacillus halodurans TaxID=237679 RepID=A0A1I0VK66_9BACI|nr:FAD-dependent oxidoreductase [Lentibacillus halodurans]SFA75956.1 FAD dependent oxidoreductase [Lentibacillus halodurans]
MNFSKLHYYVPVKKSDNPQAIERDLIIYGSTPAGITAAVQAERMGLSVAIAEFGRNVGGISASGLGATDLGAKEAIGGLSREFYTELGKYYQTNEQWIFEPKAAKYVFDKWLQEHDIEIFFEQHLDTVTCEDGEIKAIVMEKGNVYKGEFFIDASYEGDLLAKAGISYFVGRESNATYKEKYNGVQFGHPHHQFEQWVDPYVVEGKPESGLLPGITENNHETLGFQGQGDKRIQAYNFRICLTKDPENRVPFPKPPNYDSNRYLLLLRYIKSGVWDAMKLHTMLPNGKTDLNNHGAFSTDNIGMNYDWLEGDYETRERIFQDHFTYDLGMLYFLANDTRVPTNVREEVSQWGLAKDEFTETGHWPHQLYIREGKRMISDYVMTDNNCLGNTTINDSIGLASYQMDSHHCRRVVINGRTYNEGDVEIPISPYPISYRSIRPMSEECTNLLVPVCLSSSHIAYGSIRMEPVFMILGQSAGAAASLAHKDNTTVQDIEYQTLKRELESAGQVLEWDDSIEDDPVARMEATFGENQ